jgi:hypothetical protein
VCPTASASCASAWPMPLLTPVISSIFLDAIEASPEC